MKKVITATICAFGYVIFLTCLLNLGTSIRRGSEPAGILILAAFVAVVGISRYKIRTHSERVLRKTGSGNLLGLFARSVLRLLLGWGVFAALGAVLVVTAAGGSTAGFEAAGAALGGAILLIAIGVVASADIPWRLSRRWRREVAMTAGESSGHPGEKTSHEVTAGYRSVVITSQAPIASAVRYEATTAREKRATSSAMFAGVAVIFVGFAAAAFWLGRASSESTTEVPGRVKIVALNDTLTEQPSNELRQNLVHAVVIVGQSWVTFDGGWRSDSKGEQAALAFAVFEGRRRGATSLQIALRPRYDRNIGFFIYESAKLYEPDGTLVYQK